MASRKKIILKYVGAIGDSGPSFLPGVPARDLTPFDIEERGLDVTALVESGLYVQKKKTVEVKDGDRI
jgi:hypothetical protein